MPVHGHIITPARQTRVVDVLSRVLMWATLIRTTEYSEAMSGSDSVFTFV
jgi:hypothetical protein